MWMGIDFTTGMKNQRVSRAQWRIKRPPSSKNLRALGVDDDRATRRKGNGAATATAGPGPGPRAASSSDSIDKKGAMKKQRLGFRLDVDGGGGGSPPSLSMKPNGPVSPARVF